MKCSNRRCFNPVEPERLGIHLTTCRACGDAEAQVEIAAKRKRIGVAYNKGAVQYLGDAESARRAMRDAGRKDPNLTYVASGTAVRDGRVVTIYHPVAPKTPPPKRKVVGFVMRWNPFAQRRERQLVHEGDTVPDDLIKL